MLVWPRLESTVQRVEGSIKAKELLVEGKRDKQNPLTYPGHPAMKCHFLTPIIHKIKGEHQVLCVCVRMVGKLLALKNDCEEHLRADISLKSLL